jgi:protein disulfide-isomerase
MKKQVSILACFLLLCVCSNLWAQESKGGLVWQTDMLKANELSKKTGKPIFAFFTGSDWCGWCHKLQKDVFSKPEFIAWAKKNVVLLELDFPRRKQLSPALQQQNMGLQQALQVQGYPTIWLLYLTKGDQEKNFTITTLGSLGYPRGAEVGKEEVKFLDEANAVLKNGKTN